MKHNNKRINFFLSLDLLVFRALFLCVGAREAQQTTTKRESGELFFFFSLPPFALHQLQCPRSKIYQCCKTLLHSASLCINNSFFFRLPRPETDFFSAFYSLTFRSLLTQRLLVNLRIITFDNFFCVQLFFFVLSFTISKKPVYDFYFNYFSSFARLCFFLSFSITKTKLKNQSRGSHPRYRATCRSLLCYFSVVSQSSSRCCFSLLFL